MQTEEQEQLSIEEKSKLFVELLEKRKKHFASLRAQEKRSKPPTKAQKRNTMCTYLKNMAGYKHNQLKSKSYDEIQEMFDKEMKRVNTFVDMNTELVKGSKTKAEGSSKRAGDELEHEKVKKQKGDDDQEEEEMKKYIEIVKDDEVAIDAIPLATKPPVIVEYQIDKDGRMGYFKLIRADGSSKRYSSMIKMLQGIDREDLETIWKLVKAKHENTRPEDNYERVLWGDLKVMFKPDIKSKIQKMNIKFRGGLLGLKDFKMILRVTIVKDDEVAIDVIPLATKPPVIVEYQIDKDGRIKDLETIWKLVKAKHENTRPEDNYERVLWGDLKVMFKPDIKNWLGQAVAISGLPISSQELDHVVLAKAPIPREEGNALGWFHRAANTSRS
ncbi:hypothetical protein Tco_0155909 [Tanacetum coccineum]